MLSSRPLPRPVFLSWSRCPSCPHLKRSSRPLPWRLRQARASVPHALIHCFLHVLYLGICHQFLNAFHHAIRRGICFGFFMLNAILSALEDQAMLVYGLVSPGSICGSTPVVMALCVLLPLLHLPHIKGVQLCCLLRVVEVRIPFWSLQFQSIPILRLLTANANKCAVKLLLHRISTPLQEVGHVLQARSHREICACSRHEKVAKMEQSMSPA